MRDIQQALTDKGFDPGPVDGGYGRKTKDALKACIQADCRLADD